MPNTFAYIVLFAWPLVVVILFRRLPAPAALVWSVLGGYLLLPPQTGIDLPVLPPLDKVTIPSFAAAIMCLLHKDRKRHKTIKYEYTPPRMRKTVFVCMVLLFGGIILTGFYNSEAITVGRLLPGLGIYDIGSMTLDALVVLIPFILARRHLATYEARVTILRALVFAGLAYSLLILVEVRLSPQLNRWLYGFYAHSFAQQIRFGGFRPTVFIEHGLRVALFIAMSLIAAITLWRSKTPSWTNASLSPKGSGRRASFSHWGTITIWLFFILILCKSIGAFIIAILSITVLLCLSPRGQLLATSFIAATVLLFPILRGADLVPTTTLVEWASAVDEDRANSLKFRFNNEDILLDRANEKPLVGWGTFGRNRVFDPDTGRDLSVTDGTWVILMGSYGWLGYLARFGLLTLPILMLAWRSERLDHVTSGLAVVLTANLLDLLPNSGLTPITWMIAGALSAKIYQKENELSGTWGPRPKPTDSPSQLRRATPKASRASTRFSRLRH